MEKIALITGITGQDGSYLTELLLDKGYEIHGIVRRHSTAGNEERIAHLIKNPKVHLHYGDLTDSSNLARLVEKLKPAEVYNLAAQSHVGVSFDVPEYTAEATGVGTLRLLEAIKQSGLPIHYYQASTSELFGGIPETAPQSEKTPFYPKSPYGVAKLYSYWITVNYRESYGLFACNGILFNHESPRRGENFVTRKITLAVANILAGNQEKLSLGNMDAKRDWGFAGDYVEGMWRMLQQEEPGDYVLATNETHTVREFVSAAFKEVGIDIRFGPAEVEFLWGDCTKAETELGWRRKTDFSGLVKMMVNSDVLHITGKSSEDWRYAHL